MPGIGGEGGGGGPNAPPGKTVASAADGENAALQLLTSAVSVSFIDPSTPPAPPAGADASGTGAGGGSTPAGTRRVTGLGAEHEKGRNLYDQVRTILERDYASTLHGVPYRNLRTGAAESIDALPVRPHLAGAGGGAPRDAAGASGGTADAGRATGSSGSSDPAEWHRGPYCHVYVAACRDVDHYRARVRPALRAFVSQVEGAGSGLLAVDSAAAAADGKGDTDKSGGKGGGKGASSTRRSSAANLDRNASAAMAAATAGAVGGGNYSSQYLIVYVPLSDRKRGGEDGAGDGDKDGDAGGVGNDQDDSPVGGGGTSSSERSGGGGLGLRNRLARARNVAAHAERMGTRVGPTVGSGGSGSGSGSGGANADAESVTTDTTASVTEANSGADDDTRASSMSGLSADTGSNSNAVSAAPPPGPIVHSSKHEKELHKKFCSDFPNGRTVILSTLLESSQSAMAACSPLKNQEWKTLLQALGSAIVAGFRERVARYDDELRRLNALRAAASSPSKGGGPAATAGDAFDLAHFFLIKESLAFTYEQMQLPGEALLQYEELGAIVPEGRWHSSDNDGVDEALASDTATIASSGALSISSTASSSGVLADADSFGFADLANSGNAAGFRRKIRKTKGELTPGMAHLTHQYLYAREVHLLFKMGDPVEVIRRTQRNIAHQYRMMLDRALAASDETHVIRARAEAEAWALGSCWDVKCAADGYFSFVVDADAMGESGHYSSGNLDETYPGADNAMLPQGAGDGGGPMPNSGGLSEVARDPYQAEEERDAACQLGDLLAFARLRLLRLGDVELVGSNPIRDANVERPKDMNEPWVGWEALNRERQAQTSDQTIERSMSEGSLDLPPSLENLNIDGAPDAASTAPTTTRSGMSRRYVSPWLRSAFTSTDAYIKKYLELSSAIIALNEHSGRYRFAARLLGEKAEILILQKNYDKAAQTLMSIVDVFAHDQWDGAYYWRLFRLASCQRMTGEAASYLNTLTRCFGPRLAAVASSKSASLLQTDLEYVVGESEVAEYRLGVAPFLEVELTVQSLPAGKTAQPLGFLRKKLVKHFCYVGEIVKASLSITSHLPRPITVDGIRMFLLTSERYEAVHRVAHGLIEEEDSFRVLTIEGPVEIQPGPNTLKFEWTPMTIGHYILSTVEVQWKEASFHFDASALRRPVQSIEVMPSEPTQTIELNPLFLIPGHTQQVRLVFHSGSDIVREGKVELICSDGLKVVPPGVDPSDDTWCDRCSIPLEACGPDSEIVLRTSVKSEAMKRPPDPNSRNLQNIHSFDDGIVQTMQARVTTLYHHSKYDEIISRGEEPESEAMSTLLEAMVTTLDRPALTVSHSDAFTVDDDHVMVSVTLHCNTPVPFFLKEWSVTFPSLLHVADDGDMNQQMFGHAVAEGEELFFGFKCIRQDSGSSSKSADDEPILHVILQDEFGKTFRQVLPLSLNNVFAQMRREDDFSSMNVATAELLCSSYEGVVGSPVKFTFEVDLSALKSSSRLPIVYTVYCDEADWILGGRVQGFVADSSSGTSFKLAFVGIPTQSGLIKRWPEIILEYDDSSPAPVGSSKSKSLPLITVHSRNPEVFKSLAYTHHAALACTTLLDV